MQGVRLRPAEPVPEHRGGDGRAEQGGRAVDQRGDRPERGQVQFGPSETRHQVRAENGSFSYNLK